MRLPAAGNCCHDNKYCPRASVCSIILYAMSVHVCSHDWHMGIMEYEQRTECSFALLFSCDMTHKVFTYK